MEVFGLRDTWDMFMSDEEKDRELEMSMEEADMMNVYHDNMDDFDANTDRGFF